MSFEKLHRGCVSVAAVVWALLSSFPVCAQMPVVVSATAPDPVGRRLAFAVREKLRRTAGMQLASSTDSGTVIMSMVTLDPDSKNQDAGSRTIYSVVWTVETFHQSPITMYLTSSVGLCGSGRVQECAEDLVAGTDRETSQVREWITNASKTSGRR